MANRTIQQLNPVSHKDVEPMHSREEILDKLATALHHLRESKINSEQRFDLELLYSLAKAFIK